MIEYDKRREQITIDQFFSLEDEDLKKYIFAEGLVRSENKIEKVDNDEKIGYYQVSYQICMNTQNTFYRKSFLHQWIVYNKSTKKVKISNRYDTVKAVFFKEYMRATALPIIEFFDRRLSPTLCKKIIEGSVKTLGDLISYSRSYIIRKKHLSLRTVYNFMLASSEEMLSVVENPEDVEDLSDIELTDHHRSICRSGAFTFKLKEDTNGKYEQWLSREGKKFDKLFRSGDGEVGDKDGSWSATEASEDFGQLPY